MLSASKLTALKLEETERNRLMGTRGMEMSRSCRALCSELSPEAPERQ